MQFYDIQANLSSGETISMSTYRGKVLLIVNTASFCGFTPQFTELQEMHSKYNEQGFHVLGFPCNQFRQQDPKPDNEITQFCSLNYGVSFPLFEKGDVNGANEQPIYRHLKQKAPGVLGTSSIKWNFTKFLVGRDGEVIKRYAPFTKPKDIEKDIMRALIDSE